MVGPLLADGNTRPLDRMTMDGEKQVVKWADFGITRVRYDEARTRIVELEVRQEEGPIFGHAQRWQRHHLIGDIGKSLSLVTLAEVQESHFKKGQMVHLVTVDSEVYVRVDEEPVPADNLGKLPRLPVLTWDDA